MADFPLHVRTTHYVTEHGQVVQAKRAFALCEFLFPLLQCDAMIDTGASLSVIPFTLSRRVPWNRMALRLTRTGKPGSSALIWQGIPCELGIIQLCCVHLTTGLRSGALRVLAKFPIRPALPSWERIVIVGLSAVEDNAGKLLLEQTTGGLSGWLSFP